MFFLIDSPKYGLKQVYISRQDRKLIEDGCYLSKSGRFLYVRTKGKSYLHRLVTKAPKDKIVDHINRNTLDNRRENLRVVSIKENLQNQKRPNNKTGYTGVAIGHKGKFTAQIKVNYKKIHLGSFDTIEDALVVRKEAEEKYWGKDYVQTN